MVNAPSLDNTGMAFGLVVAAGLSTAIGAAAVFYKPLVKLASKLVLAAGLGFSGGVMIYVSFVEIFVKSQLSFEADGREPRDAYLCATLCLFAGMAMLRLITILVHALDKDHHCACEGGCDVLDEAREASANVPPLVGGAAGGPSTADEAGAAPPQPTAEGGEGQVVLEETTTAGRMTGEEAEAAKKQAQLQRMGLNTAAAIAIHNFPEGLATFVATLAEPSVGVTLAIAIGIHNIPEGLCVALPIYYATNSRLKGFLWALLSGLSEPVGAFIGWLIIKSTGEDMNLVVYGVLFGVVAGMMIMIVILELLPTAYRYDPKDKVVTTSFALGMLVMAVSLCLFIA